MPNLPLDSSQGLTRIMFSKFQSRGAHLFDSNRMRPDVLVDEIKNIVLGGYRGVQYAVSRYIPHKVPTTVVSEPLDLESQHDSYQQVTNTGQRPGATPLHPLRNVNHHFTSETDESETESDQPAAQTENHTRNEPLIRHNGKRIWMAPFIIGILSLIVLPGLVVGVMTKQMSWGAELSGAIAPIVSLFAGLYYHYNR